MDGGQKKGRLKNLKTVVMHCGVKENLPLSFVKGGAKKPVCSKMYHFTEVSLSDALGV